MCYVVLRGGGDSQLWKVVPKCWELCMRESRLEGGTLRWMFARLTFGRKE